MKIKLRFILSALILPLMTHGAIIKNMDDAININDEKIALVDLSPSKDYQFKHLYRHQLKPGLYASKYAVFYKHVRLADAKLTLIQTNHAYTHRYGRMITGIAKDIDSVTPTISLDSAKAKAIQKLGINPSWTLTQHQLMIRVNAANKAELMYWLAFESKVNVATKPIALINAHSGAFIERAEGTRMAAIGIGPGGNEKTGKYLYGSDREPFNVEVENSTCYMRQNDAFVVWDIKAGRFGQRAEFPCPENTVREVNGAYSPLNDTQYHVSKILEMFKLWFNDSSPTRRDLSISTHYDMNDPTLANGRLAWSGFDWIALTEGNDDYYPASTLDVIAHEMGHIIAQQYIPNIQNNTPIRTVEESLGDITGEVAKHYLSGKNDWRFGHTVSKHKEAIRYIDQPERDGFSIINARDWSRGLDPHIGAGIFNRAFYLLSSKSNWDVRKAYDVLFIAARDFWGSSDSFDDMAADIARVANTLGYGTDDVCDAFRQVGVSCRVYPASGHAAIEIYNHERFGYIQASRGQAHLFKVLVPVVASDLSIDIRHGGSGESGDADLYVAYERIPTRYDYDCAPKLSGSDETCFFDKPHEGHYYILLDANNSHYIADLSVDFNDAGCQKSIDVSHLHGLKGSEQFFSYCPTDPHTIIYTTGGTGIVDLYVRKDKKPSVDEYDCRPLTNGNEERCDLDSEGHYYIMLKGHQDYAGVSLKSR